MSFISPQPCIPPVPSTEDCCEVTLTGFCLTDGTPIGLVIQEDVQTGWFNFVTAVFTPGPPPSDIGLCPGAASTLDCLSDSVTICPGEDPIITVPLRSFTPIQTTVAGSDSNVSLLVSNPLRLGATVFNDNTTASVNNLYLKLGTIASLTSFSCKIAPGGYYEVPFTYVGDIDGIWDFTAGNARITELT